jgi:hypothetical protein
LNVHHGALELHSRALEAQPGTEEDSKLSWNYILKPRMLSWSLGVSPGVLEADCGAMEALT